MKTYIKILILSIWIFIALLTPKISKSQCNVLDSSTLVEFYWAANGPTWYNHTNWLITPVKQWFGVGFYSQIDSIQDRVRSIMLLNNNLTGTISPLLFQLTYLSVLNLEGNNLTGPLPVGIGNTRIFSLIVSHNNLTDPLPLSLGNSFINHLFELELSKNYFTGIFPDSIVKNISLGHLDIRENHFTYLGHDHPMNVKLENNCFTFKDIMYYKNLTPSNSVSPQDSLYDAWDTTIMEGSSFVMDAWADTCSGNRYTWYKNGNWISWESPLSSRTINNAQSSHSGTYLCRVSNPSQCSGVFLWRRAIHLTVSPSAGIETVLSTPQSVLINFRSDEQMLDISFRCSREVQAEAGLYDECGRKVIRLYEGPVGTQDFHHYLGWMKKGMYIVRIKAGNEVYTRKVMVM